MKFVVVIVSLLVFVHCLGNFIGPLRTEVAENTERAAERPGETPMAKNMEQAAERPGETLMTKNMEQAAERPSETSVDFSVPAEALKKIEEAVELMKQSASVFVQTMNNRHKHLMLLHALSSKGMELSSLVSQLISEADRIMKEATEAQTKDTTTRVTKVGGSEE